MVCVKLFIVCAIACHIAGIQAESEPHNLLTNYLDICALLPRGATILRPGSCTNWIRCPTMEEHIDYEEGSCLFGLYYDKDTGKCVPAENITCPYDSKPKTRCQNLIDGAFLQDLETCTGYVYCKQGKEMHANCPGDLLFNPLKSACVYKQDYNCTTLAAKPQMHPICHAVSDGMSFADELACDTYHQCQLGVMSTLTCQQGLAFDHLNGRCMPKEQAVCIPSAVEPEPEVTVCGTIDAPKYGYFSDDESCSGYYICKKLEKGVDREPIFAKCPNGFFFDADKLSCRDRLNVPCKHDRCEGMGNKYVNIAGDCTAYARCQNSAALSTGQCPEKYFFDEKTQGCTPTKIHYAACMA